MPEDPPSSPVPVDHSDAGETDATAARPAASFERVWDAVAAISLPLAVFLVLRPETFGLTPNSLDPFFYTGYAINFDDMIVDIRDGYYFVSRWPVYMPGRVFGAVFGPIAGRLVLRWVMAALIVLSVWVVGREWRWNRPTKLVVGLVVLAMPMFGRALMTDYVEWVVTSCGLLVVCWALHRPHWAVSAGLGALSAAVVLANPLAATVVLGPLVVYLVQARSKLPQLLAHAAVIGLVAGLTVLAGRWWFEVRYGFPDVYRPTVDFFKNNRNYRDPLKSPTHSWMADFVWIYTPVLVLVAWVAHPTLRRRLLADRIRRSVLVLLAVQYSFQWLDQFGRNGNGLEISYYWSFMNPTLLIAVALLLAEIEWTTRTAALFAAGWVAVLAAAAGPNLRAPNGVSVALVVIAALVGVVRWKPDSVAVPAVVTAGLVLLLQVAAPSYRPPASHPYNMDPEYDEVFFNPNSVAADELSDAVWLTERLDEIGDREIYLLGGDLGRYVIGVYGVHVTGRWLQADPEGRLDDQTVGLLNRGAVERMAIVAPPRLAAVLVDNVLAERSANVVADLTHDGGMGYELVVLDGLGPATNVTTWNATDLNSLTGDVSGTSRIAVPDLHQPGIVAFGPNAELDSRRYRVTIEYSGDAEAHQEVAVADVAQNGVAVIAQPLPGTDGARRALTFDVDASGGPGWEVRINWIGTDRLTVDAITLAPLPAG